MILFKKSQKKVESYMKRLDNSRAVAYFTDARVHWLVSAILFLICGAAPFLPTIAGAANYNDVIINKDTQSLFTYYGELFYTNPFTIVAGIYFAVGATMLILGMAKNPPFAGGVILAAVSALFLLFNALAAGFIFFAVSYAGITEVVSLSVWGWVSLVAMVLCNANLIWLCSKLKRDK